MKWGGVGWARTEQRDGDHLYCNSGARSLNSSLARCASHFLSIYIYYFFFRIPFIGFHLHLFLYATKRSFSFLLYLFRCCLPFMFVYEEGSRFMRSLSIFHDSLFYCLYESFYPVFFFLLARRDILLRSVTFL